MKVNKKIAAVAAATGGLVLAAAGVASAHAGAEGVAAGSPGVVSGNQIQIPVHVPVNVCGNTVSVIGVLNPAFGNHCANI
ncbi:chaplin [Kitasatospora sp. NPDC096140]|uniref:chaplin n=1 Tax=unclassified Kitasatospora TaxID=2633591 RepID=UPI0033289762